MRTLGRRIIDLDPPQGFAAETVGRQRALLQRACVLGRRSRPPTRSPRRSWASARPSGSRGALGRGRQHRDRLGPHVPGGRPGRRRRLLSSLHPHRPDPPPSRTPPPFPKSRDHAPWRISFAQVSRPRTPVDHALGSWRVELPRRRPRPVTARPVDAARAARSTRLSTPPGSLRLRSFTPADTGRAGRVRPQSRRPERRSGRAAAVSRCCAACTSTRRAGQLSCGLPRVARLCRAGTCLPAYGWLWGVTRWRWGAPRCRPSTSWRRGPAGRAAPTVRPHRPAAEDDVASVHGVHVQPRPGRPPTWRGCCGAPDAWRAGRADASPRLTVGRRCGRARALRGHRGVVQARELVELADPRAESPQESRTRLRCVDAGFPCPEPQIEVFDATGQFWRGWTWVAGAAQGDRVRRRRSARAALEQQRARPGAPRAGGARAAGASRRSPASTCWAARWPSSSGRRSCSGWSRD